MQRFPKLIVVVALLFSVVFNGCSSSPKTVNTQAIEQSFAAFEQELEGHIVNIFLGDGNTYRGKNLQINASFTSCTDNDDQSKNEVPTFEVWQLQITNHGKGGLKGLVGGTAVGSTTTYEINPDIAPEITEKIESIEDTSDY